MRSRVARTAGSADLIGQTAFSTGRPAWSALFQRTTTTIWAGSPKRSIRERENDVTEHEVRRVAHGSPAMTGISGAGLVAMLDALDGLKAEISVLMRREDGDFRLQIIQLRRKISQQTAEVGAAGEQVFAGSAELATFRVKFSKLRAATAAHQAKWPAVLLGERRKEFLASVDPMRTAGAEFSSWVREALRHHR